MKRPRPWRSRARAAALAAGLCLLASTIASGQATSATVSGTVKDALGGVLAGVHVTLTSQTQSTVQETATDALGNFLFPYVRPDTYALKITLQGFTGAEQTGLVVNANDRIMAGHFTLAVGDTAETVSVTAPSSLLQLKSGERGFTLQAAAMQNLGVPGRSFFGLAAVVPGVVPNAGEPTRVDAFNINGQRSTSNNVTIDGVGNIDTGGNGGTMVQTNLDAVAEFKVLTSSYQAEYGRSVGGQVQVVTKSGAQRVAGSAYWYGRRSAWNANTWLNERDGTPKEESSRNDQGYTIGGPVYVPGRFNTGKDKLFFFWGQEFQRRSDPVAEKRVTVPTALERQGDFSQSVDASGNAYPYIRDYTTGLPCNAANTAGCFRHQGVLGRIDPARLYAPTLAALSLYPLPNVAGEIGYNYKSQEPSRQPINQSILRIDYPTSRNWRLTGRYMWHTSLSEEPYGPGSNVPTVDAVRDTPGYNWLVSMTGILGDTTSIELSVGSAHTSGRQQPTSEALTRTSAGMTSLPMLFPGVVQDDIVPTFVYGGGRVRNAAVINTSIFAMTNDVTTYDVLANLTKVLGSHALKAGLYVQRSLKDQAQIDNVNGGIFFDNGASNPYDSTHPYANAALGIYRQFQQPSAYLTNEWRYSNVEWYVQDNWKPLTNLTLDYGVRFYFLTPQHDASHMASNWLPEEWDPAEAVRLFAPAVVGGVYAGYDDATGTSVPSAFIGRVVPGSGDPFNGAFQAGEGISDTLSDGSKFRVSPRAGFAYDLTGRQQLVARGGFALLYDRPAGNQVFGLGSNPPSLQVQTLTWGLAKDVRTAVVLTPTIALSPSAYNWKVPAVYHWNAGLQMRLPLDFALDVAYVGSKSENLLQRRNVNAVPYGAAYQAENRDPTRGQPCSGCSPVSAVPGGNALPADFMRPYRGYGDIAMWEFGAYSHYNALQTSVSRRLSKGLMFSGYYTWSSAKGTLSADYDYARIDGRDREADYGPLAFDRPHVLLMSFVYQAPDSASGALGYLTNGWQVSGSYRWLHGTPYTALLNIGGGTVGPVNMTGSPSAGPRIALTGDAVSRGWSWIPTASSTSRHSRCRRPAAWAWSRRATRCTFRRTKAWTCRCQSRSRSAEPDDSRSGSTPSMC